MTILGRLSGRNVPQQYMMFFAPGVHCAPKEFRAVIDSDLFRTATLSRQLIDDVAYIPLFYTVDALLLKPYVLGAGSNNMFNYPWNQIQLTSH